MKKTAAILLLAILAFNWIGYRFVSGFFERKADEALEARIDRADYDESSLITITIPLNAPYLSGTTTEFERCEGRAELHEVHYQYVKRRIVNGNLVLLCLPNDARNRIGDARMNFFKLVNDLNQNGATKEKGHSAFKSFSTEYSPESNAWNLHVSEKNNTRMLQWDVPFTLPAHCDLPEQPPRL